MDTLEPFHFLHLSAELRNRIYDYATDNGHGRPEFLHLTQTCQQVRAEFRPIYMMNTPIYVKAEELDSWLFAFLPEWDENSSPKEKLAAHIEITDVDAWFEDDPESSVGLASYMHLLVAAPNVHITISAILMTPEGHQIQRIFEHRNEWAKLAEGTVEEATLIKSTEFYLDLEDELNEFCVRLRSGFVAPWVKYQEEGAVIIDDAGPVEFLQNLGFREDEEYSVWLILQHDEYDESPQRILGF